MCLCLSVWLVLYILCICFHVFWDSSNPTHKYCHHNIIATDMFMAVTVKHTCDLTAFLLVKGLFWFSHTFWPFDPHFCQLDWMLWAGSGEQSQGQTIQNNWKHCQHSLVPQSGCDIKECPVWETAHSVHVSKVRHWKVLVWKCHPVLGNNSGLLSEVCVCGSVCLW